MNQKERIQKFMQLMTEVTNQTGITYAVAHSQNIVIFDIQTNEPVELEITVGTEVKRENGQTQITTFDKSNI